MALCESTLNANIVHRLRVVYNCHVPTKYTGKMDGTIEFTSPKPFVILGWGETDTMTFDNEREAKDFLKAAKSSDRYAAFARLYGFSEGKWVRL